MMGKEETEPSINAMYEEAGEETDNFIKVVREYEETLPSKYKGQINFEDTHTWQDVLDQVDSATRTYKNDEGKGHWEKVRKSFWKFGRNNTAFESWLGLLPTQSNYVSVLCGGFKLIIMAAGRMNEIRTEIFQALEDIPDKLRRTQVVLQVFQRVEPLHNCSSELYVATLQMLAHIIYWYKTHASKKILQATFSQSRYEAKLSEKISEIEKKTIKFNEIAVECSYIKQEVIHKDVLENRRISDRNRELIAEQMRENRNATFEKLDHLTVGAEQQSDALQRYVEQQKNETLAALNSILRGFDKKVVEIQAAMKVSQVSGSSLQAANKSKIKEVLTILDYDPQTPTTDLRLCLGLAKTLQVSDQDRAAWTMHSSRLRTWITRRASSMLFINGNSTNARRSPISFVCAKLSDSVGCTEAPNHMLAIHFFCGEHINRMTDPNASLQGMLNSLLAQLLAQHPNVNITPELLASVQSDNIDSLCDLFDQCVRQFPRGGILFCVVDGISWYEDTKRRTDVQKTFERIASLTEPKSTSCIFKVLVTSPTKMRYMPGNGSGEGVLVVPGRLPPHGGFTDMKWSSKGGKDVEGLRM